MGSQQLFAERQLQAFDRIAHRERANFLQRPACERKAVRVKAVRGDSDQGIAYAGLAARQALIVAVATALKVAAVPVPRL